MGQTHCASTETVIFSCQVNGGKHVSVCASAPLDASRGYLQYRFGALGRIELEHPGSTRFTQKQFRFGVITAPTAEVEELTFTRGDYLYAVYRRITNEGPPENGGGVSVSRASTMEVVAQMECRPPATFPRMSLERVVPPAE